MAKIYCIVCIVCTSCVLDTTHALHTHMQAYAPNVCLINNMDRQRVCGANETPNILYTANKTQLNEIDYSLSSHSAFAFAFAFKFIYFSFFLLDLL